MSKAADVPYPADGRGAAEVLLELVVDREGKVERATVVRGDPPFATVAERAAAAWKFEPAMRNGEPVRARIRFLVTFTDPSDDGGAALRPMTDKTAGPGCEEKPCSSQPGGGAPLAEPSAVGTRAAPIEITVVGQRPQHSTLTRADVRQLPGAFGDPFRAVEALPGVTPIASGVPYFYVRGAPPGNIGYFFDGVRVPVLFHLAAGPAVIAPWIVDEVKLYAGGYPARYGRYSGGIVTASAAEPTNSWRGFANVRVFDASAMGEAPFADGKGNVILGGRYSYTAAAFSLFSPDLHLGYWDYQGRAKYDVTSNDTISVLAFGASDVASQDFGGKRTTIYDVGFHRLDARYDRRLSSTRRVRLAATIGADRSLVDDRDGNSDQIFVANARSLGARIEYVDRMRDGVELRAGADWHREKATTETPRNSSSEIPVFPSHDDDIFGIRADAVLDLGSSVTVVPGLRFDVYNSQGTTVPAFEPRLGARFRASRSVSLFHEFGVAHQLPSYIVPVPGFRPSLVNGLQQALQSSSGVEVELPAGFTSIITLYQNVIFNSTDRLAIAGFYAIDGKIDVDARSTGHSFGAELVVRRALTRRLGGFVAYTLARSVRSVGPAHGPAAVDRTHVLNFALGYDLGRHWRAGLRAVFYTGQPARVGYLAAAAEPPRAAPFYRFDWRLEKRWPFGDTRYIALVFEFLNTTLNSEVARMSCSALYCRSETIGPIAVPSVGVEAAF